MIGVSSKSDLKVVKKFKFDNMDFSKVLSMADIYNKTSILSYGHISSVKNIVGNTEFVDSMNEMLYNNTRKLKKFKAFSDEHLRSICAMEWLCHSPSQIFNLFDGDEYDPNDDIPKDELWLVSNYNEDDNNETQV